MRLRAAGSLIIILIFTILTVGCGLAPDEMLATDVGAEEPIQLSTILPSDLPTPVPTKSITNLAPMVKEARYLTLEWPARIRVGDSDVIRLTLEVDDQGILTPTAIIAGHEVRGEVVYVPDLYDTHNIIATARLDLTGMQIIPNSTIEQPLVSGEKVDYFWSVMTDEIATYRGTVWLYLRFLPLDGGEEMQKPLTAQVIEISSVNLFGLGGTPARLLGSVGIIIGALLGLDDILMILGKGYRFLRKGA